MWDLPLNPNGPIGSYKVFYRASDTVQTPPINSDQYSQTTVMERQFEIITGLTAFTNYSIHVQAFGTGGTPGGTLQGDVDEEILQRTFTTTPVPPTVGATNKPTIGPTTSTIFIYLPPPEQIETGPVM